MWMHPGVVAGGTLVPVNSITPAITGNVAGGNTVFCSTGTWTGSPTSYAYQWKADGTNIAGATNRGYTNRPADLGKTLTCVVTATNGSGSVSATSAATATVYAAGTSKASIAIDATGIAGVVTLPKVHFHPHTAGATLDGSNAVTTVANQGTASLNLLGGTGASSLGGPIQRTDAFGVKRWHFTPNRYAECSSGFTADTRNQSWFAVFRNNASLSLTLIGQGSVTQGSPPVSPAFKLGVTTQTGMGPQVACGTKFATEDTNGNGARGIVGTQKAMIGAISRDTAQGGSTVFFNENKFNISRVTQSTTGTVGFELNRGSWAPGTAGAWGDWDLLEIIGFDRRLTDNEGLYVSNLLKANHGIETVVGTISLDGHSIMASSPPGEVYGAAPLLTEAGTDYCLRADYNVYSIAVPGNIVSELVTRRDITSPVPSYGAPRPGGAFRNLAVFDIGANDWVARDVRSLITAYMYTTTTGILQRGWTAFPTVPSQPFNANATKISNWNLQKAWLRSGGTVLADTHSGTGDTYAGLVRPIDVAAWDGSAWFETGGTVLPAWFADDIHPNVQGQFERAKAISAALQPFLLQAP